MKIDWMSIDWLDIVADSIFIIFAYVIGYYFGRNNKR